jgi:hypothetical protein
LFFSSGRSQRHSLARWIVHPIVVAHRENRQQRRTIFISGNWGAWHTPLAYAVTAGQKRLVIVGVTGMVGGCALRYALDNSAVECVTSIGRKRLGISHPKVKEVLHQNFADCSALADALLGQDAAVYCLGAYTGSVSDAELRAITADFTIEFA